MDALFEATMENAPLMGTLLQQATTTTQHCSWGKSVADERRGTSHHEFLGPG